MKDKLEPNMYVRTDNGIIGKIYEQIGDMFTYKDSNRDYITYGLSHNEILKASHNIIDILEVGDAIEIDVIDKDNYPTIMGINFARIDNKVELASIKDMLKNESAKLLTVITHEQMEQMAYKVEE